MRTVVMVLSLMLILGCKSQKSNSTPSKFLGTHRFYAAEYFVSTIMLGRIASEMEPFQLSFVDFMEVEVGIKQDSTRLAGNVVVKNDLSGSGVLLPIERTKVLGDTLEFEVLLPGVAPVQYQVWRLVKQDTTQLFMKPGILVPQKFSQLNPYYRYEHGTMMFRAENDRAALKENRRKMHITFRDSLKALRLKDNDIDPRQLTGLIMLYDRFVASYDAAIYRIKTMMWATCYEYGDISK